MLGITEPGPPFLSPLPVIGWLFGGTEEKNDRTELPVPITRTVIDGQEQAREVTEKLRRRLRTVIPGCGAE